jgi:hypothetical protein
MVVKDRTVPRYRGLEKTWRSTVLQQPVISEIREKIPFFLNQSLLEYFVYAVVLTCALQVAVKPDRHDKPDYSGISTLRHNLPEPL